MEIQLKPETESRLNELSSKTGRSTDELVEDAVAGYLAEVIEVRKLLKSHYEDIKSGKSTPLDREAFLAGLRQREDERLKQFPPK